MAIEIPSLYALHRRHAGSDSRIWGLSVSDNNNLILFRRYYTDVVLVAVVALCALDNDIIHAAYLAIALLLFRQRDQLREQGNFLFKWLVIYNFLVMLTTIVYQAPLYRLINRHPPDGSQVTS